MPGLITVDDVERLTRLASKEGTATLISVIFVIVVMPFLSYHFNKLYKILVNIDKNTKGYISNKALRNVLKIYVSDIRNETQSYIYNKIENNNLANHYEGYIENDIINIVTAQVNEKREALINLTKYNSVNQFKTITERKLTYHMNRIKKVFLEEVETKSINYENLKDITNREMEQFEQETMNQLNKIF